MKKVSQIHHFFVNLADFFWDYWGAGGSPANQAGEPPAFQYCRPRSALLYLELHPSVLCFALFGGVVGDGLVGAVAFGDDVGGGAAKGDEVVFH